MKADLEAEKEGNRFSEIFASACYILLQFLSLVLAENFLKFSPICLLACASSGTHGKIQNQGFLWPESLKKWPFLPKIQFFEGF